MWRLLNDRRRAEQRRYVAGDQWTPEQIRAMEDSRPALNDPAIVNRQRAVDTWARAAVGMSRTGHFSQRPTAVIFDDRPIAGDEPLTLGEAALRRPVVHALRFPMAPGQNPRDVAMLPAGAVIESSQVLDFGETGVVYYTLPETPEIAPLRHTKQEWWM